MKVKFSTYQYRVLLEERAKAIEQLDVLLKEQQKDVFKQLQDEGILDENINVIGLNINPANEEEAKQSQAVWTKYVNAFYEKGGISEIEIELEDYESKFLITPTDILKCIL